MFFGLGIARYLDIKQEIYLLKGKARQHNLLKFPLNFPIDDKYVQFFNFIGKIFLDSLILVRIVWYILTLVYTIISYLDPVSNYSIPNTIFWFIISCIVIDQTRCLICGAIIVGTFTSFALIIKFNEISDEIGICIAQNKRDFIRYNLIDLIEEHNYFTKITADINKLFRIAVFFFYYFGIPLFLSFFYGSHHRDTEIFTKIVAIIMSVIIFIPLMLLGRIVTKLVTSAHTPFSQLISYFSTPKRMRKSELRLILKLMTYMERLSGPEIGFYCYDLFPINSWEFYQFIAISFSNNFLLMEFV